MKSDGSNRAIPVGSCGVFVLCSFCAAQADLHLWQASGFFLLAALRYISSHCHAFVFGFDTVGFFRKVGRQW